MKYEYTKEKRDPQIQWYKTESGKRWRVKFSVMKKGTRHHLQKNGLKSFADAQLVKAQMLTELDRNNFVYSKNTTVQMYWQYYHDSKSKSGEWRPTTTQAVSTVFRVYILPYLGERKMSELTRQDIQQWINSLAIEKDLSRVTALNAKNIFKAMLEQAVVDDELPKNPARKISVTGRPKKSQSMSTSEYQQAQAYMYDETKTTAIERGIFILSQYGLRRGEIAGMRVQYITPTSITVAGQLNRMGIYTGTKTSDEIEGRDGIRTIPITPDAYRVLSEALDERRKNVIRDEGRILNSADYAFSKRNGRQLTGNDVYNLFAKMSRDLGFKVWPHKMRHAFSTMAFSTPGLNPKDIMNILGHSNLDMSMMYNTGTEEGMEKVVNSTFGSSAEVPH